MSVTIDSFRIFIEDKEDYKLDSLRKTNQEWYNDIGNNYCYRADSEDVLKEISKQYPDKAVRLFIKTDYDDEEEGYEALNGEARRLIKQWI